MSLVALLCSCSIISIFYWVYRDHTTEPCSNWDKKKEQCSVLKVLTSANPLQVRDIRLSILLALETILCSWIFQDKLLSTSRPKSLNSETTSRCFIHTEISLYCLRFFRYSHYFAFLNVKIHSVQFTPRPKIIKVFLKQCATLRIVNYPRSFVVFVA